MADEAQVSILKEGSERWNAWRREHPKVRPDLDGADLSGAGLDGANLNGSKLSGARLSGTRLSRATFIEANLGWADLSGATLREARLSLVNLSGANFRSAKLSGADLSYADLIEADLSEAHLNGAHLNGATLYRAKLSGAKLSGANLSGADLGRADLSEARLWEANFREADLSEASLSGAILSGAILSEANLRGADLSGAKVSGTHFADLDLRGVKGLEEVTHDGPSHLSTSTLVRSQGEIPEVFLRGVGLDDTSIEYVRSLVNRPIAYYACFLSYASANDAFAQRLYADLQSKGVRCWFAPEDLKIGDHYHQRIDESIRLYDKLVLILSEHAIQSAWVEREVVAAREKEDQLGCAVLFPIRLDDAVMDTTKAWAADVRRRWHIGDFTQWKDHDAYQQAFERLLRDLKAGI